MSVRILGIDPGSRITGFGIVDLDGSELRLVRGGVIRVAGDPVERRLARIYRELLALITDLVPDSAALESIFSARNPRSALLLGQARGAALAACGQAGLVTAEYSPMQVKLAVAGYGRADKAQVQQMVQRLLGQRSRCPSDQADALAVAICHGNTRGPRGRAPSLEQRA